MESYQTLVNEFSNGIAKRVKYNSPLTRVEEAVELDEITPLERGHRIMDSIRDSFDLLDKTMPRSFDQRIVHNKILGALSRFIYGSAFGTHEIEIKDYNQFDTIKPAIAFSAPRQLGKSSAIAMMCCVLLLSVPGIEIAIVAQGGRAAGGDSGMLLKIIELLTGIFKWTNFKRNNKNTIRLYAPDRRQVSSFSSESGNQYVFLCGTFIYACGTFFFKKQSHTQMSIISIGDLNDFCACKVCKKTEPLYEMYTCQSCTFVEYCSSECQKVDWKTHKNVCGFFKHPLFSTFISLTRIETGPVQTLKNFGYVDIVFNMEGGTFDVFYVSKGKDEESIQDIEAYRNKPPDSLFITYTAFFSEDVCIQGYRIVFK